MGVRAVRGLTINQKCDDAFCLTRGNLRSNGEHELRWNEEGERKEDEEGI